VTESVTPNETPSTSEPSEAEAMEAIYDRLNGEDQDSPEPNESASDDAREGAEDAVAEVQPEEVKAPTDLPGGIKAHWTAIPEEARQAITDAHREMASRNAEMGRQNQATKPVYDILLTAARDLPELADMTPEQIGQEVFNLAKVNAQIQRDPVGTIVGFIQKFNVGPQVAQLLGGQVGDQTMLTMQQQLASLTDELSKRGDPQFLEAQFTQFSAKQQAVTDVNQFAAQAEHWDAVVNDIPMFIEPARSALDEGASHADVLSKAYDLATFARGLVVKAGAGDEPAPVPDPEKAQKVKKATSVNIPGTASDTKRTLSEQEELGAAYDRAMNS
jgi:hypothetical protein